MKYPKILFVVCGAVIALALLNCTSAAEREIDVSKIYDLLGFLKPVPVNISGFTGESDSVLKNDLLFMGVVNVPLDQAQYLVTGSAAGNVQGRVVDKVTRAEKLNKAYSGGSTRA